MTADTEALREACKTRIMAALLDRGQAAVMNANDITVAIEALIDAKLAALSPTTRTGPATADPGDPRIQPPADQWQALGRAADTILLVRERVDKFTPSRNHYKISITDMRSLAAARAATVPK